MNDPQLRQALALSIVALEDVATRHQDVRDWQRAAMVMRRLKHELFPVDAHFMSAGGTRLPGNGKHRSEY